MRSSLARRNTTSIMQRILIIEDEPGDASQSDDHPSAGEVSPIVRRKRTRRRRSGEEGKARPHSLRCDDAGPGRIRRHRCSTGDAETVTIPLIFLTAKAEKLDIRTGMNLGADDYITKPVAKADLLAAIHSRLDCAIPASSAAVQNLTSILPYRWRKCLA